MSEKSQKPTAELFNFNNFDGRLNPRRGSEKDVTDLKKTLSKFCIVTKHFDLKIEDFIAKLKKIAERDHTFSKYIFIYISSHGIAGEVIFTRNGSMAIHEITSFFQHVKCPKIFLIQACRGETYDDGASPIEAAHQIGIDQLPIGDVASLDSPSDQESDDFRGIDDDIFKTFKVRRREMDRSVVNMSSIIPSNCFIAYSTPPNRYSWRSKRNGGYYVQTFISQLKYLLKEKSETAGPSIEISNLIMKTNDAISTTFASSGSTAGKRQIGHYISTLDHRVYLDL